MKTLIAFAVLSAAAPAIAAADDEAESAGSESQRRVCTRVERYGGSRLSFTRVCLTEQEWRERLGADWRQRLAGRNVTQDDLDNVEARSRDWSNIDSEGLSPTGAGRQVPQR